MNLKKLPLVEIAQIAIVLSIAGAVFLISRYYHFTPFYTLLLSVLLPLCFWFIFYCLRVWIITPFMDKYREHKAGEIQEQHRRRFTAINEAFNKGKKPIKVYGHTIFAKDIIEANKIFHLKVKPVADLKPGKIFEYINSEFNNLEN